jgi:hypothetical protein
MPATTGMGLKRVSRAKLASYFLRRRFPNRLNKMLPTAFVIVAAAGCRSIIPCPLLHVSYVWIRFSSQAA